MTARTDFWATGRPLPGPRLLLAFFLLLSLGLAGQSLAASEKSAYDQARKHFQDVSGNRKKAALRSQWEQVEQEFAALYKANPKGSYAAKSLLYAGRVYEDMASVSGLKSDLLKAEEYYGKSMREFPRQRDMDELLLRRGRVRARLDLIPQDAYASIDKVTQELRYAERLCLERKWRSVDVTGKSVEEVSREIITLLGSHGQV